MNTKNNQQLVINDSALIIWAMGAIPAIAAGISLVFFPSRILIFFPSEIPILKILNPIMLVLGLVLLFFYPNLTIIADRSTRILRLEYRYLLFYRTRLIPFDDIKNIHVEKSTTSSNGHSSKSYRIAAMLKDGKNVPFRLSFSGEGGKTRHAAQLQAFINRKTLAQAGEAVSQIEQGYASDLPDETGQTSQAASIAQPGTGSHSEQEPLN